MGQNPERVVEGYTEEFEASFLELLRQSHPFSRVAAKVVYNDYIANKCVLAPLLYAEVSQHEDIPGRFGSIKSQQYMVRL